MGVAIPGQRSAWALKFGLPFVLCAVVLAVFLFNRRFNESTDTFGNELLPISILQQHSLSFDQYYVAMAADGSYPIGDSALADASFPAEFAYRLSPELPGKSIPWWFVRVGGHVVSLYPITPGLLNTPIFAAAQVLGVSGADNVVPLTRVTTSAIAALSVLCMYLCLVQVCARQRAAVFLTLNFAFATAIWSANSRSLFQHGAAVLFLTAALAALISRRVGLVRAAGVLLGLLVVTRPTTILIAAALALFVYRHERAAFSGFALLAVVPAGLIGWYSWAYWGTPLTLGQGQLLSQFTAPEPALAAVGLLISPNRGLLVFSPIFIFSVAYSAYLLRRTTGDPLLRYLIWSAIAVLGLYTLWSDWAGGHTYGYRFLIELVPALMLVLAACWERLILARASLRALFMVAMFASVYVQGLGAMASPCGFDDDPNNIDAHHERLWDIANGEIARCTITEIAHLAAPPAN